MIQYDGGRRRGNGAREGEQRRKAEERDIEMSSNGVSSFLSAWGKLQLQWKAPEDAQTAMPVDDVDRGVDI